jgi:predicted DCC family thiol-disulfide oxidoreductase YuxK/protein-S-isoprenylcysteine O-methyltransferase Ste14
MEPWLQSALLDHLTLFRTGLFLCCCGYWVIGWNWLRPDRRAFQHGVLAALMQFWLGLAFDAALQPLGGWQYRAMPFNWFGVPIDLHLDWALIWGFGLVWLSERWPRFPMRGSQALIYLVAWTLFTLGFDACVARWMIFLQAASTWWWAMDLGFLFTVQGATLIFYASIGKARGEPSGLGGLSSLRPWHRSWVYMSFFFSLLFWYFPSQILQYNQNHNLWQGHLDDVVLLLGVPCLALGAWSIYEFDVAGEGTPLPWDHPRRLVSSGPYAFVGNPMQLSSLGLATVLLLWRPSALLALYVFNMSIISAILFRMLERQALPGKFGRSWSQYAAKVRDWRPRLTAAQSGNERPIIFFDGNCGLCQRSVRTVIQLDAGETFRFAPLGGKTHKKLGLPDDSGREARSFWLYEPDLVPRLSQEGPALLRVLGYLPALINVLAALQTIPGFGLLVTVCYRQVSRHRQAICAWDPAIAKEIKIKGRMLP